MITSRRSCLGPPQWNEYFPSIIFEKFFCALEVAYLQRETPVVIEYTYGWINLRELKASLTRAHFLVQNV